MPASVASRRGIAAAACLFLLALPAAAAPAETAAQYCRRVGTDDAVRPIPQSLVRSAARLFVCGAKPPVAWVRQSTFFRCAAGRVLLCNVGANLPCGKANASRRLPGAAAWCAGHPGSPFIPAYVTGHDTIYQWRCNGARAEPFGTPLAVDRRGFIAEFWKPLGAPPPRCR